MTTRALYKSTIEILDAYGPAEAAALKAEFEALLEKMDSQNEARRVKTAEKAIAKQAEKEPIRAALFNVLGDESEPKTASMLIADAGLEVKPASVPSLLRPLIEIGAVVKVDMKIPGKGTQRGYVKG